MDQNTFLQLLGNAELLVSLSILYQITIYLEEKFKLKTVFLNGILLGLIGVALMSIPFRLSNGTLFDTRSILISLVGLIFGYVPALISAVIMIAYRVYLGGPGALMGSLVIISSCGIGLYWTKLSKFMKIHNSWFDLYLFGLLIHAVMLIWTIVLPASIRMSTLNVIAFPVLIIYPLATVVVGKLLQTQKQLRDNNLNIKIAERKFHSIFDQAKIGIGYTDFTGKFMDMNQMFCDTSGYTIEELRQLSLMDLIYQDNDSKDMDLLHQLKRNEIQNFTIDERLVKKDGLLRWVNLTISLMEIEKDKDDYIMCAIVDIDDRKKAEELMLYLNMHDQQTDMFNRRYFEDKIQELDILPNHPLAVILINCNGLKIINDAYGYKTGDIMLKKVAGILNKNYDDCSLQARISGSEFALVYTRTNNEKAAEIVLSLRKAFLDESVENIHLSITAGYAIKENELDDILETFKLAENRLSKENLIDKTSMASRTIDIIMNSLFEKNSREMLHSKRVSQLCEFIAGHLHLEESEINKIKIAGLMHDIGKIGINDTVLNKIGKLTTDEWEEIKRHSEVGYRILSSANEFSEIADYILSHHERWDGNGYPRGLKGEQIHLYSRIISIADAFDAMTSERTYRGALSIREAIDEIKRNSGTQFDPHIAEVFVAALLEE
jgi:PAS domain S-box-containing protein/diguanylate cyclase (GGDEF)-like protein